MKIVLRDNWHYVEFYDDRIVFFRILSTTEGSPVITDKLEVTASLPRDARDSTVRETMSMNGFTGEMQTKVLQLL